MGDRGFAVSLPHTPSNPHNFQSLKFGITFAGVCNG